VASTEQKKGEIMARHYHFVIHWDDELEEYYMDYEQQDFKFGGRPIYNTDTGEWEKLTDQHWEQDNTIYNRANDALVDAIDGLRIRALV
jgi:hypothetical protein